MLKTILRLALLSLFTVAAFGQVLPMDWNMVGSAGSIDPGTLALGNVQFFQMTAQHNGAALGQIVLRYPVTNTYGSFSGVKTTPWTRLEVGHVDNGGGGGNSVVARLFQVNRCTNVQTQIAILNSLDGGGATVCPFVNINPVFLPMDFGLNIYYVEVVLNRNNAVFTPSLQYVALW